MLLPRPEVFEHRPDELPTEFRALSVFAPLMMDLPSPSAAATEPAAPRGPVPAEAVIPAAPGLELATLERFQRLMSAEGWPVQIQRMCFDRLYARERIALGHTSASWHLRQLSLQLFRHYDDPLPLH